MSDHSNAMTIEPVLNVRELKKMVIKTLALSSGEKHLYIDTSRKYCLLSNISLILHSKMLKLFGLGFCGLSITDHQDFRAQERKDDNNSNKDVFCFQVKDNKDNKNIWIDMVVFDLDKVQVVVV